MSRDAKLHLSLLALAAIVLAWSGTNPKDRLTWLLEVSPAIVAGVVLAAAYPRWRFTPLVIVLIAAHAMILMVGGKYTYAEVPAFNWLKDEFDLSRNYFDRVGHFAQGFVPAMVAREILLRQGIVKRGGWLFFLVTCVCMAVSAFYEFIEWWTALAAGGAAEAFLGTQGDVWDTQWDMFTAMCGAIVAQLLLSRWHDRQIAARPAAETVREGNP
jgi:putative membrane protein